jgi:hypothetical protein
VIKEISYTGSNTIYIAETDDGSTLISTRLNQELPGNFTEYVPGQNIVAIWQNRHVATIPK